MPQSTKQATDKGTFQWRESPFVTQEGPLGHDEVGEANPSTESDQTIKRPQFKSEV